MITYRFHCRVEGDKLEFDRPELYKSHLQYLSSKGDLELIIRPWRIEKSLQQLRYFHGVICFLCSEASGYTPEEVKGLLKSQFLKSYVEHNGKEIEYVRSLADLSVPEMAKFIENSIILAASHWGVCVPDPSEVSI